MTKRIFLITFLFVILFSSSFFLSKSLRKPQEIKIQKKTKIITFSPQTPSLAEIFSDNHDWTATLSASHIRVIAVTGDIIPARSVNAGVVRKNNPLWPYEKVKDTLQTKKRDALFVNLESPLIPSCPTTDEGMSFCGGVNNVEGLKEINVTIASLANNHLGNHGIEGIQSTEKILHDAGIKTTGTGNTEVINIRGLRFAFLGFNDIGYKEYGLAWANNSDVERQIKDARKIADVVLVMYHFGTEYQAQPDKRQELIAHLSIDSGADVVLGNHPHWIQPVEFYRNKLITYAHGNFVFDQMWSLKTRQGVIGYYTFYDNKLIDVAFLPLQIDDYGQPHFLDGVEKRNILESIETESRKRNSD